MKIIKYLVTVLVSLILSINVAIAEKWDMALSLWCWELSFC